MVTEIGTERETSNILQLPAESLQQQPESLSLWGLIFRFHIF